MLTDRNTPNCDLMERGPEHIQKSESAVVSDEVMALIREICREVGIKQRDLAAHLHLKPSQMNLYFSGKVEMRTERLVRTLEILGVDVRLALRERLAEIKGRGTQLVVEDAEMIDDSKILAKIGRVKSPKRESLLRIIELLGS